MFFKCKHPAARLVVERDSTVTQKDEDFNIIVHHLRCRECDEEVSITYAQLIGGVDAFMKRGLDAFKREQATANG
jgi:hypothetical protein